MKNCLILPLFLTTLPLFTEAPTAALPFAAHKQNANAPTVNAHTITNNTVNITIDQRQTSAVENVLAAQQTAPEAPAQKKQHSGSETFITTIVLSSLAVAGNLAYEVFWNIIDF